MILVPYAMRSLVLSGCSWRIAPPDPGAPRQPPAGLAPGHAPGHRGLTGDLPEGFESASYEPVAGRAHRRHHDRGARHGLAMVALIVGALGLVAGVAGLLAARRARA